MRINKYIAGTGLTSRRKAETLVLNGNVRVNGAIVRELSFQVEEGDVVEVNGRVVSLEDEKVYFVFNKPCGVVTTMDDEKGRPTVADFFTDVSERVVPVGRLDINTSGLLIVTNDGDFANMMMHPSREIDKVYHARIQGHLSEKKINLLEQGIEIEGRKTAPAKVKVLRTKKGESDVEISIHEGRNRQVRKMFSSVGCPVNSLKRVAYGSVRLGRLQEGSYKKIKPSEVKKLIDMAK